MVVIIIYNCFQEGNSPINAVVGVLLTAAKKVDNPTVFDAVANCAVSFLRIAFERKETMSTFYWFIVFFVRLCKLDSFRNVLSIGDPILNEVAVVVKGLPATVSEDVVANRFAAAGPIEAVEGRITRLVFLPFLNSGSFGHLASADYDSSRTVFEKTDCFLFSRF